MTSMRFVVAAGLVAVFGSLGVSAAQSQPPSSLNRGTFRFDAPAGLTVKSSCAIGLKNGAILVA